MAFQISPGVNVSEVDLTTVVPSILTTAGAYAGNFQWGPVNKRILVDSEITLNKTFGIPDSNTYVSFFTAASFLAYGNNLQVVRSANTSTFNAQANTTGTGIQIANEDIFQATYLTSNNGNAYGAFTARYPGALGNSLTISLVDAASYSTSWNIGGVGIASYVNGAPGTSSQAASVGAANDEVHIVVMDTGGLFTGAKNSVLEVFQYLSKGLDAKNSLGNSNYYKNYIYNNSKYIYAIDPVSYATTSTTWGQPLANTNFATVSTAQTFALTSGADAAPQDADRINAYSYFTNADAVNISLVMTGGHDTTVQQYVIDNIANARKDCVAFVSPPSSAVVNQAGNEVTNIQTWNTSLADRKSTRLNSSHIPLSRMPSSA